MTQFTVHFEPRDDHEMPYIPCASIALEIEESPLPSDSGISKLHLVHELGIDEAYELAEQLVSAANKRREIENAKRDRGEGHQPSARGPYVLSLAKKRVVLEDAKERMEAVRKQIVEAVIHAATGPTNTLYQPDRMRAWAVQLPDDPEVSKLFTGIMLDNLGGVSVLTPGPARLVLSEGNEHLMSAGYMTGATGGRPVRLELRPIVPIATEQKP